jgi:hypothetical protein
MLVDDDGRPAACSGAPYRLGLAVADLDADVRVTPWWTDWTAGGSRPMIFGATTRPILRWGISPILPSPTHPFTGTQRGLVRPLSPR